MTRKPYDRVPVWLCKCPHCDKLHEVRVNWTGRALVPPIRCPECERYYKTESNNNVSKWVEEVKMSYFCDIKGCGNVSSRRGLCARHFKVRYGFDIKSNPDTQGMPQRWWDTPEEREIRAGIPLGQAAKRKRPVCAVTIDRPSSVSCRSYTGYPETMQAIQAALKDGATVTVRRVDGDQS